MFPAGNLGNNPYYDNRRNYSPFLPWANHLPNRFSSSYGSMTWGLLAFLFHNGETEARGIYSAFPEAI